MTSKSALLRGAAVGAALSVACGASAQAQTRDANAELRAQLQALQAQVAALQARLDAQEQAQARATAAVDQAQTRAAAAEAQVKAADARLARSEAAIAQIPAPPAYTVAFDGAPRISGGGNSLKIRGRLLIDAVSQSIDRPGTLADTKVEQIRGRQAFIGVEGNIGPHWFYKIEGGAANGGAWSWDDANLEYRHDAHNSLVVGNQKTVGLENLTSVRFTSFLDRGPMDTLIDATYHLGAVYWRTGDNYSFNAGITGHTLNSADVTPAAGSSGQHERWTASARVTVAPINSADTTVHLGLWGRYRKRGDDGAFTYTAGYNSPLRVQTPVTTGAVGDHDTTMGLEGALVHRSLSVQGEWARTAADGPALGSGAALNAGYAFVSWFATGERRNYAVRGEFGRTKVLHPLGDGGFGALELLARYDFADFTDAKTPSGARLLNAGTYEAATLGANWYPIGYVRFMANYTRGKYDNLGLVNDADIDLFQLRAQIDW